MQQQSDQTKRRGRLIAGAIGGLLLLAITAAFIGLADPGKQEPGSPEAAVQDYVQAVFDEDHTGAIVHLAPELQERCMVRRLRDAYVPQSASASIVEVNEVGHQVEVGVEIKNLDHGVEVVVLEPGFDRHDHVFVLERVGPAWKIVEPPWPFYWCGGS